MSQRPTLLVFTLGPECERSRRRLLPGALQRAELELYRRTLEGTLEAGRQLGLRLVVSAPRSLELPRGVEFRLQKGCSFGERLRGAIRTLGDELGGAPLLVVGTDTPDLQAEHLRAGLARLDETGNSIVVGPSPDGGFYLLATRTALDVELEGVRWCRGDTRRSLIASLEHCGRSVELLEPLRDLDSRVDLERWLAGRRWLGSPLATIRRWLRSLVAARCRPAVPTCRLPLRQVLVTTLPCRAPPR